MGRIVTDVLLISYANPAGSEIIDCLSRAYGPIAMPELKVHCIPAFQDNYLWLLDDQNGHAAIVDPGDSQPVLDALERLGLNLTDILITHHHADHIGGLEKLKKQFNPTVYAPIDNRIPGATVRVSENDSLQVLGRSFLVLEVPGHTLSHIAYFTPGMLFCGDTLFSVGCGRLFEGTPVMMQESLDKIAGLPDDTSVYCAHEYTESNCQFALAVEPGNLHLQARTDEVRRLLQAGHQSIPTRLGSERLCNPFLRTREASVIAAAQLRDPDAEAGARVLGTIRDWKDSGDF